MAAQQLLLFLGLLSAQLANAAPLEDLVQSLPGQPKVSFKQYAGYVTVHRAEQKALFYYFVEAEHNASEMPLSLWLNGGPGCSSLGGGAFTELGPFYPDSLSDGLERNAKSWNAVSNILFVDSPIGVGWSYSNLSSSYKHYNDAKTAQELERFLHGWFSKFPEYRHHDLYITGESYAGHYAPDLASRLMRRSKKGTSYFNLKGMLIGNPALNNTIDSIAAYEYLASHGILSQETYHGIVNTCNMDLGNSEQNLQCKAYLRDYDRQVENIDEYDVLLDVCQPEAAQQAFQLKQRKQNFPPGSIELDVCMTYERTRYFNRPEVQKALHANTTGLNYTWSNCGAGPLHYDNDDVILDMIPVLRSLLKQGLRIQLFSGDADSVVPFLGTQKVVALLKSELNLTTTTLHSPWYSDKQVAGWMEVHGNLSFATVRGAGHMVPYAAPGRALTLFKAFVEGKHLPR